MDQNDLNVCLKDGYSLCIEKNFIAQHLDFSLRREEKTCPLGTGSLADLLNFLEGSCLDIVRLRQPSEYDEGRLKENLLHFLNKGWTAYFSFKESKKQVFCVLVNHTLEEEKKGISDNIYLAMEASLTCPRKELTEDSPYKESFHCQY